MHLFPNARREYPWKCRRFPQPEPTLTNERSLQVIWTSTALTTDKV
ncbi:MAG: hypothetical protein SW833_12420 [Cyanobacteriota bacterium]|nr:hypothetical protein [Cyanobacteriota bacterium]